jgi:hypothetical protein
MRGDAGSRMPRQCLILRTVTVKDASTIPAGRAPSNHEQGCWLLGMIGGLVETRPYHNLGKVRRIIVGYLRPSQLLRFHRHFWSVQSCCTVTMAEKDLEETRAAQQETVVPNERLSKLNTSEEVSLSNCCPDSFINANVAARMMLWDTANILRVGKSK